MKPSQLNENEYSPYFKSYITLVETTNLFEALTTSLEELVATVENLPEEKLLYKYAEGKWSIKELIQHLIDTERILSYRALRFSRSDTTDLHGFDEDWYVKNSNGNERDISDLLEELTLLRRSTILLFNSFSNEMLTMSGSTDESSMSVRALGFIVAGHQMHHLKIIRSRYL